MSLKVWQSSVFKPIGDTFPTDSLLTHTSYHLGDVDERAWWQTESGKINFINSHKFIYSHHKVSYCNSLPVGLRQKITV